MRRPAPWWLRWIISAAAVVLLVLLILLTGCATVAMQSTPEQDARRVLEVDFAEAYAAGDLDRITALAGDREAYREHFARSSARRVVFDEPTVTREAGRTRVVADYYADVWPPVGPPQRVYGTLGLDVASVDGRAPTAIMQHHVEAVRLEAVPVYAPARDYRFELATTAAADVADALTTAACVAKWGVGIEANPIISGCASALAGVLTPAASFGVCLIGIKVAAHQVRKALVRKAIAARQDVTAPLRVQASITAAVAIHNIAVCAL